MPDIHDLVALSLPGSSVGVHEVKVKQVLESKTTDSTITADNELEITDLDAGKYSFECTLFYAANAGGLKFTFSGTGVTQVSWGMATLSNTVSENPFAGTQILGTTSNVVKMIRLVGKFTISSNGGSFALFWSQNVSNAAATTIDSGSSLTVKSTGSFGSKVPNGIDVSCKAKLSTGVVVGSGVTTTISWDGTDEYDTLAMHDPVTNNNRITFNRSGKYLVNLFIEFNAPLGTNTGEWSANIKNSSGNVISSILSHESSSMSVVYVGEFVAGDWIEATARNGNSTSSHTISTDSYFAAHKIDELTSPRNITVVKSTDQTETVNTPLQTDNELAVVLAPGAYAFDLHFAMSSPAATTMNYTIEAVGGTATGNFLDPAWNASTAQVLKALGTNQNVSGITTVPKAVQVTGYIIVTITTTLTFKWAGAGGSPTATIKAGSSLTVKTTNGV